MLHQAVLQEHQTWIRSQLDQCIGFWLDFGMDTRYGGVLTCLDENGAVYSTDKSVWMQGRCAWLFSYLCHRYGMREEWRNAAKSCIEFLETHCVNRAQGNRLYFTVTREGAPLRQRRYSFSEAFYIMANAEYGALTRDETCLKRARTAFELVYQLQHGLLADPTGLGPKTIPDTRKLRALAEPMIYLNLCSVMRRCDPENVSLYNQRAGECVETIFQYHHKPDLGCTLETVGENGEFLEDISACRMINPGHAIECSWFLMEEAIDRKDATLMRQALEVYQCALDKGWDRDYEGLLYFVDCLGKPPESYEHDMKLWWPHTELLIASLMAYRETRQEAYWQNFEKTLSYCKRMFALPKAGEWYGYLRRDGQPTMPPAIGSTFKGPFHLPRMLIYVDDILSAFLKSV